MADYPPHPALLPSSLKLQTPAALITLTALLEEFVVVLAVANIVYHFNLLSGLGIIQFTPDEFL